jgi:hypothetical protein
MKRSTLSLFILSAVGLLLTCASVKAQTVIYYQSFDSSITNLPIDWTATPNGWVMDTSNSSAGQYTGASGGSNVVIKNDAATGVYELVSSSISTVNYKDINATWAARLTKNFTTPGSYVQGFYMTVDSGATWDSIPYTENPTGNSSPWLVDNNASPISLPSTADHKAAVQFKWVVDIVNNSQGTYRIDDFAVSGTYDSIPAVDTIPVDTVPTSINNIPSKEAKVLVYTTNGQVINVVLSDMPTEGDNTVEVYSVLGDLIDRTNITPGTTMINAGNLSAGVYLVRVNNRIQISTTKVVISR